MDFTIKPFNRALLAAASATIVCAAPAYAIRYLTVEEAQRVLFPQNETFTSDTITLSETQRSTIESITDDSLQQSKIPYWRVMVPLGVGNIIFNISFAYLSVYAYDWVQAVFVG